MALTNCPSCNKRISDKAEACPHCEFRLSGLSQDELSREWSRVAQARRDKLLSQSMLALLIAIAAFTYFFIEQPIPGTWQSHTANALMLIGVIWFVINRVRIMFLKRSRR